MAERRVRVLHVFGAMDRGGAEMRTLEVMRRLPERFELHYCTLSGRRGPLADEVTRLGGHVHPMPLRPTFPVRFVRLLRRHSFDVVHSHVHLFSGVPLALARSVRVPRRVAHFRNMHDGSGASARRRVQREVTRRLIDRHATHVLAVCEGAMEASWGPAWRHDRRCQVVYNGIDLDPFRDGCEDGSVRKELGVPDGSVLVAHVGRMQPQKNHARVLSVFAQLVHVEPRARLMLVGGRDRDAREAFVREQAKRLDIHDRVLFLGERDDVPRLLSSSDVLLFPSLWEGLPGAVLEACAAGTPVVASDLPGVREIMPYFPGVRCLPLGSPDDEWARALHGALHAQASNDEVAERFAKSPFAIDACVRRFQEVWDPS